jgi:hypothetical protein
MLKARKNREINELETLSLCGMITLKWSLKTYEERVWTGFVWLRIWATDEVL